MAVVIAVLCLLLGKECNAGTGKADAASAGKAVAQGQTATAAPQDGAENSAESPAADGIDSNAILRPAPLKTQPEQILVREGYIASYNKETLLPNWVAWHLTKDHTNGSAERKGTPFSADEEVPMPRALPRDYTHSGYDRGHMCPAGDNRWSTKAMRQSFLLTNICPQNHNLNTGDWNELEASCRRWAAQYGDLYIVAGPVLLNKAHKTIGQNGITVPEAFFKVVLCLTGEPKAIGFIYRNEATNKERSAYANSVDQVERITGMDFFAALPDSLENRIEAVCNPRAWGLTGAVRQPSAR